MEVSSTGVNSGNTTQVLTGNQGPDDKDNKVNAVGEDLRTVSQILTPVALMSTESVRLFEVPDKLNEVFGPMVLADIFKADAKFLARFQEAIVSRDGALGVFVEDLMGAKSRPGRQTVVDVLVQLFEYLPDASRVDAVNALVDYKVDGKGNRVEADGVGVIALRGFCDELFETIPETDKAYVKDLFDKHEIALDA
ncbi:hypothetical protein PAN31117_04162 [Pandoraea anapnoica]|uniref:Uncharacterized protein n=1 Tax=Pandoraea anapnoica TaxID=2508301 RepID=A0A5E5ADT9_9BURK|nr:hypothetical protein [Pandoraea anapnoica]VVE71754.1 hypothetical protein PAN31117_04162 [Pandoraea anapnoica]